MAKETFESFDPTEAPARPMWKRWLPLGVLLAIAVGVYLSGVWQYANPQGLSERFAELRALVEAYPLRTGLAFVLFYALAVSISLPGALWFTIAAGALFGWIGGALIAWAGATSGAVIIFVAVQSALGQRWAEGLFGTRAQSLVEHLRAGLQRREFLYLILCRIVPLPFFLVNVAAAFAGARLPVYAGATALGIIPGTVAYAALGSGLGDALAAGEPINTSLANVITDPRVYGAFVLVIALTALAHFAKGWRKRLEQGAS